MADYTRMVAYIFEYDHDKKGKNVGFAKIESRNDQCRISISLRGILGNRSGNFKVYTYTRENNKMTGILIGEIIIRNGRGELKVVTPSRDIWGTGYSIEQMGGIIILNGTGEYIGTEWDDNPIDMKYFIPYSSKEKRSINNENTLLEKKSDQRSDEKSDEKNEKIKIWKDKSEQKDNQAVTTVTEEIEEESIAEEVEEESIEDEIEEKSIDTEIKEEKEESVVEEKVEQEEIKSQNREENWKNLIKKYPRISPFEDTNFAECIRIEPKDLVHLRKEDWALGNNSFLLHGYYSYRYLILGRRKDEDGFILGVPGVYFNKEYLMAKMFGFADFIPARRDERKNAIFGYWCRKV